MRMKDLQLCTATWMNLACKAEQKRSHVKDFFFHDFMYIKFRSSKAKLFHQNSWCCVTLGEREPEREPRQGAWGTGSVGVFAFQRCIELGT